MVKKERYTGLGIDQDTAPDKRKTDSYWDAENIRIVNNGRGLSIKPINGETLVHTLAPIGIYPPKVVGYAVYNSNIFVFGVIDSYYYGESNYCFIKKITETYTESYLAGGWYGWDKTTTRVETLINYENDDLIKLYFIDGINPLSYINISDTAEDAAMHKIVEQVYLVKATTVALSGGSLTSGTIQYVYNGYNLYGSQSVLSPASDILSISKFYAGFAANTNTGMKVEVTIPAQNIVDVYDFIRVYSIHYLEKDQTPQVKLIYDEKTPNGPLTINDDGNLLVANYSLQDLLSIAPAPYIPNTFAAKRDRLFIGNFTLTNFNPDIDTRAYSFASISTTLTLTHNGVNSNYANYAAVPLDIDAVNPSYDTYQYQRNSTVPGGTGTNVEYSFITQAVSLTSLPPKSLKKFEVYRIGLLFRNTYGQQSPVKWVADFRVPGNIASENVVGVSIKLTSAGEAILEAAGAVNYQLCIVERRPQDRSIIAQGFIVPSLYYYYNDGVSTSKSFYMPYYMAKDILSTSNPTDPGGNIREDYTNGIDFYSQYLHPVKENLVQFFYSTDTIFETSMVMPTKIRVLGEAIKTVSEGNNNIVQHRNDSIVLNATTNNSEPYWGDLGWGNPHHVMAKTSGISSNVDQLIVFTIATNKLYKEVKLNDYSTTDRVITLETGFTPATFLQSGGVALIEAGITVQNNADFRPLIAWPYPSLLATTYICNYAPTVVLNFNNDNWHKTSPGDLQYSAFDADGIASDPSLGTSSRRGLPLVELLQDVPNQYNGNSYEVKRSNEYLPLGNIHPISTTPQSDYIGDIWLGTLSVNRTDGMDQKVQGQMGIYEHVQINYIENNHNVYARQDKMHDWTIGWFWDQDMRYLRLTDNHRLNAAYNQVPNVFKAYSEPYTYRDIEKFPITVFASDTKTNGETLDSWLKFNPNNFRHMEGQYGPISKLHNLKGDLICLQSSGIALLEIEPRVQTISTEGTGIQMGIGSLFYNYKYLTTTSGTDNKWTVCDDGKDLYYYNNSLNIICSLQNDKLSTIKTVKAILDANTSGPHTSIYFNKLDQVYFQYNNFTLVYDLLLQKFIAKYTLLNNNKNFIVRDQELLQLDDSLNTTGLYTQYTGAAKGSNITYIMCPDPTNEKVFHNLEYRLIGSNFTEIEVHNDRSTSGTVLPDIKTKFDIHRVHLPRVANSSERWRGIYVFVKLSNTGEFSLDDLVLMYNLKG